MNNAIDQDEVNSIKELMREKFVPLVERYIENAHGYVEKMKDGLANGAYQEVAFVAHSMKSPSAMLGLKAIAKSAEEMEILAKQNVGLSTVELDFLLKKIERDLAVAEKFLREQVESFKI